MILHSKSYSLAKYNCISSIYHFKTDNGKKNILGGEMGSILVDVYKVNHLNRQNIDNPTYEDNSNARIIRLDWKEI